MIIKEIDIKSVAFLEAKNDLPIAADSGAPEAFQVAAEAVKTVSWDVHVLDRAGGIQTGEHKHNLVDKIGPQLASIITFKKPLEAAMPNVPDHRSSHVN
jgi:hypothetical protein